MSANGNRPTYPCQPFGGAMDVGLTKREYFAGLAMQALIHAGASIQVHTEEGVLTLPARVGVPKVAVAHADALLAELEKDDE